MPTSPFRTESPFQVESHDASDLEQSEVFQAVTDHLMTDSLLKFCVAHEQTVAHHQKEIFLLHRDITHALFMPLLHVLKEASSLAANVIPNRSPSDMELAFRGEARSAYSWLQCLLAEERDWCLTKGCPACVVLHTFHSEPHIRLMIVACRVSEYMKAAGLVRTFYHLPSFNFWMESLRTAVQDDSFWGVKLWQETEDRALQLEEGVRQLISQCFKLRDSPQSRSVLGSPDSDGNKSLRGRSGNIQVKASALALRQTAMKWEERIELSRLNAAGPIVGDRRINFSKPRHRRATILNPPVSS